MSFEKYSPNYPHPSSGTAHLFKYNYLGKIPHGTGLDSYDGYDSEGFDLYGYSALDRNGNYIGNGVDRDGWTEMDYLSDKDGCKSAHLQNYNESGW